MNNTSRLSRISLKRKSSRRSSINKTITNINPTININLMPGQIFKSKNKKETEIKETIKYIIRALIPKTIQGGLNYTPYADDLIENYNNLSPDKKRLIYELCFTQSNNNNNNNKTNEQRRSKTNKNNNIIILDTSEFYTLSNNYKNELKESIEREPVPQPNTNTNTNTKKITSIFNTLQFNNLSKKFLKSNNLSKTIKDIEKESIAISISTIKQIIEELIPIDIVKKLQTILPTQLQKKYDDLSVKNKKLIYKLCFAQVSKPIFTQANNFNKFTQFFKVFANKYKTALKANYLEWISNESNKLYVEYKPPAEYRHNDN
jgi:hypothetical protein